MRLQLLLAVCVATLAAIPAQAEKLPSDKQLLRQQAEHLCYDDVQKLCNDAIPDEDKVKACMKVHHAQLSAPCAKVYDQGIGG